MKTSTLHSTPRTDTDYERLMREMITAEDMKRPKSERFMHYFYETVVLGAVPDMEFLPHSDLYYIRSALEAKFPGRLFTMDEIRTLLKEELGVVYGPRGRIK